MKRIIIYVLFAVCVGTLSASNFVLPDKEMPQHSRLLLLQEDERSLVQFIQGDPIRSLFQERTSQARKRLPPIAPLEKVKIGRRMLNTSREALYLVFMLSYAYHTIGELKYAERVEKEMLYMVGYDNWNLGHFLDVAEMTTALSIGYDWLYEVLSPKNRAKIRKAILDKGLKPPMDKRYNGFLDKTNNWSQVCNTAMAYGAIALMETDEKLCQKIMERSIEEIRRPMSSYGPDGAYPEGHGYWHYGTTYSVMLLAALETLYSNDFGLSAIPGFIKGGEHISHMVGPSCLPFNFGDSGSRVWLNASLFWFTRKTKNPALLRNECKLLLEVPNYDYEQYRRMLSSIFMLGKDMNLVDLPKPKVDMFAAENEAPVCLMRSSWKEDAIYVGTKGGKASTSTHTHLDAGSLMMDAQGVRWVVDLGSREYNSSESKGIAPWDNGANGQRWKVFRYNNFAHNIFGINDEMFNAEGRGELVSCSDTPERKEAIFNLTVLYNKIDKAERYVVLNGELEAMIEDRIKNGSQSS